MNRRIVEFDLEGANALGTLKTSKDVIVRVAALNAIRSIINDDDIFSHNDYTQKYQHQNGFSTLLEASISFLKKSTNPIDHKNKIREFFRSVLLTTIEEIKADDADAMEKNELFTKNDLIEMKRLKHLHCTVTTIENVTFSPLCTMTDWKMSDTKSK